MTKQFASRCLLEQLDETQCHLSLDPQFQSLLDQDSSAKLENALRELLAKPLKLHIEVKTLDMATPAQQVVHAQENRQQAAVDAIHQDPNVIYAKEHFDAQVLPETIQPY